MTRLRIALGLLLVLSTAGCGFHLRSALELPTDLGPVAVTAPDRYSPLASSLARALERAGAVPATDDDDKAARLEVMSEKWADVPIAIDVQGRAQEYSLRYAVVFRLRRGDGSVIVPQQAVELSRDYIAPPSDSVGSGSERELLAGEMRREMSASILRRIDAALRGTGATGTRS
jgi:LPS-assembly lipoprotein